LYGRQAAGTTLKMGCWVGTDTRILRTGVNKSFMELQLAYKAVGVLEKQNYC
jgi:hypothetical protein